MAVVVSCDAEYLKRFGQTFVESVKRNTKQDKVYISVVTRDHEPWEAACERFFFARNLPEQELVILDIDSLFLRGVVFPEGEVGLYFRDRADERLNIAAGLVVVRNKSFLEALCKNLKGHSGWFADQKALWQTYCQNDFEYFDVSAFITWEFDEKPIWTGKGALKRSETFREKMDEFRA